MLLQYSAVELMSYSVMAYLISRAIGHRIEAGVPEKRLRGCLAELQGVVGYLSSGESRAEGNELARKAAAGLALGDVFQLSPRYQNLAFIEHKVDEAIQAQFGSLYERCEQSELAGPRWGLLFTALGIMLTLITGSNDSGALVKIDFNHIALAMINTALGISIANVERSTLAFHVAPIADKLRAAAITILIEANSTDERMPKAGEVPNAP